MKNFVHHLSRVVRYSSRVSVRRFSNFNAKNSVCYYKVLGLEPGVPQDEIRKKFFEMAKVHHPDISTDPKSNQIFQELSEAYGILSNPETRAEYDHLRGYDRQAQDSTSGKEQFVSEEELMNNLYRKYQETKEKENTEMFNKYFSEKYLKRDWGLKDPMNPMNFYSEMYDQKFQMEKKSAAVY
jgi:curved DNA-binding protein CbpA